jgi:tetratricopeptide (TPR) repeat protein
MSRQLRSASAAVPYWILLLPLLTACATIGRDKPPPPVELVVPACPSAQAQFAYAKTFQGSLIMSGEKERRRDQLNRIAQCYEKVVNSFPDDRVYTPLAYLEMADSTAHGGDAKLAVSMYRAAIQKWPEIEYIYARSLLSIGRLQDGTGQFEEAKQTYTELRERFSGSKSEKVNAMVKAADSAYYQMREKQASKKKPKK